MSPLLREFPMHFVYDLMAIDPGVKPNAGFFPFMAGLKNVAGGVLSVVIVLCVIALIVAGILLAFGKMSGSGRVSDKSSSMLLWILVAAIIAGSASAIIKWATGLSWGF